MSQRYVKLGAYNYETPPGLTTEQKEEFDASINNMFTDYIFLLNQFGLKPEDARFVLPEATTTRMFITLNLRTLLELRDKRMNNPGAQWEIRELCKQMWENVTGDLRACFE